MFGSSWGNTNQNTQNQQNSTGAFGQPSGFGAATTTPGGFGSGSAFGQTPQAPANPMFGNLNPPAAAGNTNTGFGAFSTPQNNTNSAFGAAKPGAFGGFGGGAASTTPAGAFGSTGAFGQAGGSTTPATGAFGQSASTAGSTNAFGTNTGIFGKAPAFGGAATTGAPPVVTTGTSNPAYAAHQEKEGTVTSQYQAIVCMPAYAGYSFDELRVQDYAQGRKTASTGGAFGGGTGAFGQTPAAPATGIFGAQPAAPAAPAFGTTPAAPANPFGGGAFGTTTPAPAASGTGLFGSGGAFGTTPAQPAAQTGAFGTGAFGQQTTPAPATGLFGQTGGTGAFGNTQAAKPAFGGFGGGAAAGTTTNLFGNNTGGFGAQNTQNTPQQNTGLFGNTTNTTTPNPNPFGGGTGFGANAAKPLFGAGAGTNPAPATGFGGFGGAQTQPAAGQQNAQPGTGLFGGAAAGTGTGLFGQQQNQQPAQAGTGTGLFGNTTTTPQQPGTTTNLFGGGGLFGNNQQNQQGAQQSTGLFGQKPAAPAGGGLFGGFGQQQNNNANNAAGQAGTGGGLFGNTTGQTNTQSGFGSLFGKPAAPAIGSSTSAGQTGGLFGSSLGGSTGGLFGGSTNNAAQPSLTASINQPIGSNLPIFNLLPPGPRLVDLDSTQAKKKSPFFVDAPTRSPIPRPPQPAPSYTPTHSKLRGFASTTTPSQAANNPFSGSVSFLQGKAGALTLGDSRSSMGPDSLLGRSGSPALGSGSRQSVKKVILDKKVEPSQLFIKSSSPGPGGRVVFSPALSIAARESEAAAAKNASQNAQSPTPAPRAAQQQQQQQKNQGKFTAKSTANVGGGAEKANGSGAAALEEGDYWVKPDMVSLKKLGYDELSAFKGLVVGRVGYGMIEFLEPVDLTGLNKLTALLGEVIHFEDKECSVYPDSEDVDKPPPGSGLNVKARLTLERCWAVDRATREPIKDEKNAAVGKHLKKLKNMKDTKFVDFDMASGKWTFIVDHF